MVIHTEHAHQFILIEERDEFVWYNLVEALQKALNLFAYGLSHAHLCHQLHILLLQNQHKTMQRHTCTFTATCMSYDYNHHPDRGGSCDNPTAYMVPYNASTKVQKLVQ